MEIRKHTIPARAAVVVLATAAVISC